jgi:hypothetical protein
MSEPIKQHFIPQFLLRGFAQGKKNKAKLWTFDKKTGKAFQSSVKDTAHENQFYEATNCLGEKLAAEQLLTELVDGTCSSVIREIISREELPLSGKSRVDISYFVAAQMFRVPTIRNEIEVLRQTIISKWGPNISFKDDERTIGEYSEGRAKLELQSKGKVILTKSESVEFVNSLQVLEAERFLYASREADFQIVREMIKKTPELSKPASQRMMPH